MLDGVVTWIWQWVYSNNLCSRIRPRSWHVLGHLLTLNLGLTTTKYQPMNCLEAKQLWSTLLGKGNWTCTYFFTCVSGYCSQYICEVVVTYYLWLIHVLFVCYSTCFTLNNCIYNLNMFVYSIDNLNHKEPLIIPSMACCFDN